LPEQQSASPSAASAASAAHVPAAYRDEGRGEFRDTSRGDARGEDVERTLAMPMEDTPAGRDGALDPKEGLSLGDD
jgi:hypothetical protein